VQIETLTVLSSPNVTISRMQAQLPVTKGTYIFKRHTARPSVYKQSEFDTQFVENVSRTYLSKVP
jgi:hypothetical protein